MSTRIPCGHAAWLAEQAKAKPSRLELRIARELQLGPATESELRSIMCISCASRPRFANALNALRAKGKVRLRPTFMPRRTQRGTEQPLEILELVA